MGSLKKKLLAAQVESVAKRAEADKQAIEDKYKSIVARMLENAEAAPDTTEVLVTASPGSYCLPLPDGAMEAWRAAFEPALCLLEEREPELHIKRKVTDGATSSAVISWGEGPTDG